MLPNLRDIALALPGATMEMQGDHASFRVKKKVFAYYLKDHHGDGIIGSAREFGEMANWRGLERFALLGNCLRQDSGLGRTI